MEMNTETVPSGKLKWVIIVTLLIVGSTIFTQDLKIKIPALCVGVAINIFLFIHHRGAARSRRNVLIALGIVTAFAVVLYFVVTANVPTVPAK